MSLDTIAMIGICTISIAFVFVLACQHVPGGDQESGNEEEGSKEEGSKEEGSKEEGSKEEGSSEDGEPELVLIGKEGDTNLSGVWTATVEGTVVDLQKSNIDKSGRNPRYNIRVLVEPSRIERPAGDITLNRPIVFQVRQSELEKMGVEVPRNGDRLRLTGTASGIEPELFALKSLEPL